MSKLLNIDKEFEKLGYYLYENEYNYLYRWEVDGMCQTIIFNKEEKNVTKYGIYDFESGYITMKELKLIYAKCSELGWLNE